MKSNLEQKNHLNGVQANHVSLFSAQRKGAVHDLSQVLIDDCQKVFILIKFKVDISLILMWISN